MNIHLLRHGQTIWHEEKRYAGFSDIPLTKSGYEQAKALLPWASKMNICAIYSSDLIRSIETARVISSHLGVPLQVDGRLREINYGDVEGLTLEEIELRYPRLREQFKLFPAETKFPNGESGSIALERARDALEEILMSNTFGDIVLVIHGTLMRLIACSVLKLDLNEYQRMFPEIPNTSRILLKAERIVGSKKRFNYNIEFIKFDEPGSIALREN